MKTLKDFKDLVSRVTYKPGFSIDVHETIPGSIYLQVHFDSVDPQTKDVGRQHGRKWLLSPFMTDGEVVQTCLAAILAAEEHEAREFFLYNGRAIFGPHFNLQKLCLLCDEAEATEIRPPVSRASASLAPLR